jgi:diacylglycerol kinase (ATP)
MQQIRIEKPSESLLEFYLRLWHIGKPRPSLTDVVEEACQSGTAFFDSYGGDGTNFAILNGIYKAGAIGQSTLVLHPNGSGNDFARTLGIFNEEDAIQAKQSGNICEVDVGKATFYDAKGHERTKVFLNIAEAGFGANVSDTVKWFKWAGKANYLSSIVANLLLYSPRQMHLKVNGIDLGDSKRYFVSVANGCYEGGGILLAKDDKPNDGFFGVLAAGDLSKPDGYRLVNRIKAGTHLQHEKIIYLPSKAFLVEIALSPKEQKSVLIHADGEVLGYAPAKFEILPEKLKVFRN